MHDKLRHKNHLLSIILCGASFFLAPLYAANLSGDITAESRLFLADAINAGQPNQNFSLSYTPEFYREWDSGYQSVTAEFFLRLDQNDNERTHVDIRQLNWLKVGKNWEARVGIRKVFWGVTEIAHIVDIINQTDQVEDLNFEDKLGQPMLNLAWIRNFGTFDIFILPYFRERTFPGKKGRFRPSLIINTNQAQYQSSDAKNHIDLAARWSHYFGAWDIAVSHFYGTGREPRLRPVVAGSIIQLTPYYELIHQTGLELQATFDAWLLKLEAMRRVSSSDEFNAFTPSVEYTFFNIKSSGIDIGLIAEYMKDTRRPATTLNSDLFIGTRVAWNDVQSSELLFGITQDINQHNYFFFLEGSRRIGDRWKGSAEIRSFHNTPPADPGFDLRNDDMLQLELSYYY